MENLIKEINTCRLCGFGNLAPIISLGDLYMSHFIDSMSDEGIVKGPLDLVLCGENSGGCGLLQLKHTLSPEIMYREYWYRSGVNKTMTDELHGIAEKAENLADLAPGDYVIDIGANDGTLLKGFKRNGLNLTGFEPAKNLAKWNEEGTTKILNDFFNAAAWQKEFGGAKAKVITAIAMFYDLDDPNDFVADIKKCLHQKGVFIIQMNYLVSMLAQNAFDHISHEHLEYYSLATLEKLLRRHNLEVFDAELNDINGGSIRAYIRHSENSIVAPSGAAGRLVSIREAEEKAALGKKETYLNFAERVSEIKRKLVSFIKEEKEKGKTIYVYGASTRGNTLLQYFGIDRNLISAAAERNPEKWGKKTVSTEIPIISEEEAREAKSDYFLVLPWHFLPEFVKREEEYLKNGGKFIVPMPEFKII